MQLWDQIILRQACSHFSSLLFCLLTLLLTILLMTGTTVVDAQKKLTDQQQDQTKCGPVPSNEEMMKVLKPMFDLILQCLPVFEKHQLKLSSIFIAAEELCGDFDKCVPSGIIKSRELTGSEMQCFINSIKRAIPDEDVVKDFNSAVHDFCKCIAPNMPLKKKGLFAVMHWFLAMTGL